MLGVDGTGPRQARLPQELTRLVAVVGVDPVEGVAPDQAPPVEVPAAAEGRAEEADGPSGSVTSTSSAACRASAS